MDLQLDEETWERTYKPFINFFDSNASWNGWLFETYGEELKYVMAQEPKYIWTLVEYEGICSLVNGISHVNRLGFILCSEPWEEDLITVNVED
jgi:hypothetical protein